MFRPYSVEKWYIGLKKSGGEFSWLNGDEKTWTNWKSGSPGNKDCVLAGAKDSAPWVDVDCNKDKAKSVLCKKNAAGRVRDGIFRNGKPELFKCGKRSMDLLSF